MLILPLLGIVYYVLRFWFDTTVIIMPSILILIFNFGMMFSHRGFRIISWVKENKQLARVD